MVRSNGLVAVLGLILMVAGCASTVKKQGDNTPIKIGTEAKMSVLFNMTGSADSVRAPEWESFRQLWYEDCRHETAGFNASFSIQNGAPTADGKSGTLIVVDIVDFRYITAGMRYGLGVMTGNAYVNANVSFRDARNGDLLGYKGYDTSSTAWQGVFSAMTEKQIHAICHAIITDLES